MPEAPSEGELLEFLDKLAAFHSTLSPNQQDLLDEMTATALAEPDVAGFQTAILSPSSSLLRTQLLGLSTDSAGMYRNYYAKVAGIIGV